MKPWNVYIGFDPREAAAYAVARHSVLRRRGMFRIGVHGIVLDDLRVAGLYWRPTEVRDGRLWDVISEAPMATEFAISRFLTVHLARRDNPGKREGWAVFMDADMLVRGGEECVADLFRRLDPKKALMCVQHNHVPLEREKMDGQTQLRYARKNWSSLMAFQVWHPANDALTVELINTVPGRDLHRFCWLHDDFIGSLPVEWNWLAGYSDPSIDPRIVHHTEGSPCLPGYENAPYAEEWRAELRAWAT